MEDVCELSALLQEENVEKDMQESDILQLESNIGIEQNRHLQEKHSLREMIRSRERVKSRTSNVSDMLDLLLSNFDGKLNPIFFDSTDSLICPQINEYLKRREELIISYEQLLVDIEHLESEVLECQQKTDTGIRFEVSALDARLSKQRTILKNLSDNVSVAKTSMDHLLARLVERRQDKAHTHSEISTIVEKLKRSEIDLLRVDTSLENMESILLKTSSNIEMSRNGLDTTVECLDGDICNLSTSCETLLSAVHSSDASLTQSLLNRSTTKDFVDLLETKNLHRHDTLQLILESINRENATLRSAQGTLEVTMNTISSQFSIARAYSENLMLNSNSEKINVDNCALNKVLKELVKSLEYAEEKELQPDYIAVNDMMVSESSKKNETGMLIVSLKAKLVQMQETALLLTAEKNELVEEVNDLYKETTAQKATCDLEEEAISTLRRAEATMLNDNNEIESIVDVVQALEKGAIFKNDSICAAMVEITALEECAIIAMRKHHEVQSATGLKLIQAEVDKRLDRKLCDLRLQQSDSMKSLRLDLKAVDAEFKRDVKKKNEKHKSTLELLKQELSGVG